ncbi:MAG: TonB-dependent receptor plug domain-containing protein [Acidobacteria bacterium]|nr:TonB-dependent receptor plug domain-containing protein [Acidobacteriota bacterium]
MPIRLTLLPLFSLALAAQEIPDLQELRAIKVSIATRLEQSQEEAPSVVSVITRTDIERYGWRELADILRALPGFDFANDGGVLTGLSARGIWAHEGKALLMVDGICVSPLHNANANYYGSYPSEMIERVEVIRGPGSAMYGQFAGMAVINVITHQVDDGEGGRFTLRGDTLGAGTHAGGGYLTAAARFPQEGSLALNVGYQTSPFSRQPYVDTFFTGSVSPQEKGNTRRETQYLVGDLKALGTSIHFVRHEFRGAQVDNSGEGIHDPIPPGLPPGLIGSGSRNVQAVQIAHPFTLVDGLTLEPRVELTKNTGGAIFPQARTGSGVNHSGTERERHQADVNLHWDAPWNATFLFGLGAYQDWERSVDLQGQGGMRDPSDPTRRLAQVTWTTRFGYFQYTQQTGPVGFILGGRYEEAELGGVFAPRLGVTATAGPFNAKLLYGQAFRSPTLFQTYSTFFAFRGYLEPEVIKSWELELGYRFTPSIIGRLNFFKMDVTEAISFGLDNYNFYILNFGADRTRGVEGTLEWNLEAWSGFFNFSYAKPGGGSDPFFLTPDRSKPLGVSPWKANLGFNHRFGPVDIAPSLFYASARENQNAASAQSSVPPDSLMPNLVQTDHYPAKVLVNLALTWRAVYRTGQDLRLSITNLANSSYPLLQPYYGAHAPLPAHDRRVSLDFTWRF